MRSFVMMMLLGASVAGFGQEPEPVAPAHIRGGVVAGHLLTHVNPVYPPEAKANGVSGKVVMRATIGRDGTVHELSVISGPEMLQAAALEAVRQWVYTPYLLNGNPTEIDTTITVNFALGGG